jgi:hypothetical protein
MEPGTLKEVGYMRTTRIAFLISFAAIAIGGTGCLYMVQTPDPDESFFGSGGKYEYIADVDPDAAYDILLRQSRRCFQESESGFPGRTADGVYLVEHYRGKGRPVTETMKSSISTNTSPGIEKGVVRVLFVGPHRRSPLVHMDVSRVASAGPGPSRTKVLAIYADPDWMWAAKISEEWVNGRSAECPKRVGP